MESASQSYFLQKLSKKQALSFKESNHRLNIWHGAVRSGKSHASMIRWIEYILKGPPGDFMMIGKTNTSLYRNIVKLMCDYIGAEAEYYAGKQELHLWGRTIYLVGANDERAQGKIQGSTLSGAYVDEATLIPENFFNMLLSRLSVPGSQLFMTTNPDSPFHWLKTNFLDREEELNKGNSKHIKSWKFLMDDNPSLEVTYKDRLRKEYKGLWYKRYIEGMWVLAEGTIYDFFDMEHHTLVLPPSVAEYYIVGADYGTTNPTAFALIGYNSSTFPNIWMEGEYYWDSRKTNRQKTDAEFAQDLKKFIAGKNVQAIYLDPSAASFRAELRSQKVERLYDAENDVLDGIRYQSKLLSLGTYKVSRACKNAIAEYSTYRWDDKSITRGEDRPLKENDHLCDAQRYALYTHFFKKPASRSTADDVDRRWNEVAYGKRFGGPFDKNTHR